MKASYSVLNTRKVKRRIVYVTSDGQEMYLVYNERTGYVAGRYTNPIQANLRAKELTEQHTWIDRDCFDVKVQ